MKELNDLQKNFLIQKNQKLLEGMKEGKVFPYPQAFFDALRPFCLKEIPASIMLFLIDICNGYCYDRSLISQLAFKDCKVIHADIESLRVIYGDEEAEHSFVIAKLKDEKGKKQEYVIDTSTGYFYEKEFYFSLEKPKINKIISKKECMKSHEARTAIAAQLERDSLLVIIPSIEAAIQNSEYPLTMVYKDMLLKELEKFKNSVGYYEILKEYQEDMAILKTDPSALDKKYKIVRDIYGNEISRNGIKNEFYKSPEEIKSRELYLDSIKDNPKKLRKFWNELAKQSKERADREDKQLSEQARKRLKIIKLNPNKDFYLSNE